MEGKKIIPEEKIKARSFPNILKRANEWINAGSKPPSHTKKSLRLSFFLLFGGLLLFTFTLLTYLDIYPFQLNSYAFAFTLSFIMLIPGFYSAVYYFCCWRRINGFYWDYPGPF